MNNIIKIELEKNEYSRLLNYLIKNTIFFEKLTLTNNKINLNIFYNDLDTLKLYFPNIKIIKYYGIKKITEFIKKHYILLISFLITYLILIILSNVIFNVEIITNNNELKRVINLYLEESDIKKYKFMKTKKELDKIKSKILEENKTSLEWIEIERIGTKYKVELTERVINDSEESSTPRDLVASKDALIKYLVVEKGDKVKEVNELVKKGEVIITGKIMHNETVKDLVPASGKVYGEVWYTTTTSVPFTHTHYQKTGKIINHIYMEVFGKKITLLGKYKSNMTLNESKVILDKPYLFFTLVKEKKELYEYVTHTVTEQEAYEEALKRSEESIKNKLDEDEYIIDKKVLKKNVYSSKIELEVFYKVYESIVDYKEIPKEETKEGE